MFIVMLVITRVFAARLIAHGRAPLEPLLGLQFVLLAGFFVFGVISGTHGNPDAAVAVLGVGAMAVQNALVQIGVRGAPSTAVMTTNITRFTMDVGEVLLGDDRAAAATARRRAAHTWPAIVGFAAGAALGAALYAAVGIASLALPAGGALLALAVVRAWPSIDLPPVPSTNREGST